MEASRSDTAVEIALAEFNALRAEILSHSTAQTTIVGLGITALGIIIGFVVKEGADDRLLLAVPPLSMFVILLHTAESYRIGRLGDYIRDKLWPFLERQAGELPSWEREQVDYRWSKGIVIKVVGIDSPAIILFFASSVAAQLWLFATADALWWAGWAMIVIAVAFPTLIALGLRRTPRLGPPGPA